MLTHVGSRSSPWRMSQPATQGDDWFGFQNMANETTVFLLVEDDTSRTPKSALLFFGILTILAGAGWGATSTTRRNRFLASPLEGRLLWWSGRQEKALQQGKPKQHKRLAHLFDPIFRPLNPWRLGKRTGIET